MPGTDSSATPFESFVGSMWDGPFGATNDGETPHDGTDANAAGAPPAEPSPTADEAPADLERDTTGLEHDASADGIADPAAPPSDPSASPDPAALPSPDDDPFAGAEPLTYMVNGQSRTFDDIKVLKDHGGVIPIDALPKLAQRLSERDNLYERSQQQHQQYQELERLTTWKSVGPDGTEQTLTGPQALIEQRVAHGRELAQRATLAELFQQSPMEWIVTDELGNAGWNPEAMKHLATRAELAAVNAERYVRSQMHTMASAPPPPPTIDYGQAGPTIVENFAQQLGASTLTPEDKTFLAGMVERFVRPTTPEDIRENPDLASEPLVIDRAFAALVQRQAQMRATNAQSVTQASTVSRENAARLAQAARGLSPRPAAPSNSPRPRPREEDNSRAQAATDLFALTEAAASGRFHPSMGR